MADEQPNKIAPLQQQVPIVDPRTGRPSPQFMRYFQQFLANGSANSASAAAAAAAAAAATILANNAQSTANTALADAATAQAAADAAQSTADTADAKADANAAAIAALVIGDMNDVDTTTTPPTEGQALLWDASESLWVPGDVSAGGVNAVDVTIATPPGMGPITIVNPGAESGTTGWSALSGNFLSTTYSAHSGSRSFQTYPSSGNISSTDFITLDPAAYTAIDSGLVNMNLDWWQGRSDGSGTGRFRCIFYDETNTQISILDPGNASVGFWTNRTHEGLVPATTRKVKFNFVGNAAFFIDDMSAELVSNSSLPWANVRLALDDYYAVRQAIYDDESLLLPSYTVAGVPAVGSGGKMVFITDEVGGPVPAYSDGTNWRRVSDGTIIST